MKALLIEAEGKKHLHVGTIVPNLPHLNLVGGKVKVLKQFEFDDLYCLVASVGDTGESIHGTYKGIN